MSKLKGRRPSPALAISVLALFIALGGTTYALTIPRNSVGTTQIRAFGVRNSDLGTKSVSTSKLRDSAILSNKIGDGQVTPNDLQNAAVRASKIGPMVVRSASLTFGAPQAANNGQPTSRAVQANCGPGELAIGGGTSWSGPDNEAVGVVYSRYVVSGPFAIGIRAKGSIDENRNRTFTVQALCLTG